MMVNARKWNDKKATRVCVSLPELMQSDHTFLGAAEKNKAKAGLRAWSCREAAVR
jgi:hypothetical protein